MLSFAPGIEAGEEPVVKVDDKEGCHLVVLSLNLKVDDAMVTPWKLESILSHCQTMSVCASTKRMTASAQSASPWGDMNPALLALVYDFIPDDAERCETVTSSLLGC